MELWTVEFKNWLKKLENDDSTPLHFIISNSMDILNLHNFFLVCQKYFSQNPKRKNMNLNIECPLEEEYRIKHFLYLAKYYPNVRKIQINGKSVGKLTKVNFYRFFPLILIDEKMLWVLSQKVSEIEGMLKYKNLINEKLYESLQSVSGIPIAQVLIFQICIYNLTCEVQKGAELYSERRRNYFQSDKFHEKIRNLPFLALFIFSIFNRTKCSDTIDAWKAIKREQEQKKNIRLNETGVNEIFFHEEDILSEIFNAWDISDGLLELIENVVRHAGNENISGKGTLFLRIHHNSKIGGTEFDENSELFKRYKQYFRGYRNEYVLDEYNNIEGLEMDILKDRREELNNRISKGQYVDGVIVERYEKIRKTIEKRRTWRRQPEYFLEVQVADYSGRNMMEVFLDNLKKRKDKFYESFKTFSVGTLFNPSPNEERILLKEYYKNDNIIKHYGLQIFSSIVSSNEGSFEVRSQGYNGKLEFYSTTTTKLDRNLDLVLPGTQYNILLPLTSKEKNDNINTLVNVDINYKFKELENMRECKENQNFVKEFYKILHKRDYDKENWIVKLSLVLRKISNHDRILVFDCDEIKNAIEFEVFCKSLLLTIVQEENRNKFKNIAIKNCEEYHFVNIIRFFIICYDKNGKNDWLGSQIYLCGRDSMEEFLISGNDIQVMLARVEKLAISRRMSPRCVKILREMLIHRNISNTSVSSNGEEFEFTPFDLLITNEKNQTVFEQNVIKVLSRNIQKIESGCKIYPTHMRIGSKLHMNAFYEAELLFYNDYYVNRFAYLVMEQLMKEHIDFHKPLCLIGYEIYSEMLLCRVKRYINEKYNENCSYTIYVAGRDLFDKEKIRMFNDKDIQVILIVPINSTLTTFNKLEAEVNRSLKKYKNSMPPINVKAYIGIIQVLNDSGNADVPGAKELEYAYWDYHIPSQKNIYSQKLLNGNAHKASYVISAKSKWENPIKCKRCYPVDCLFEVPLVETDKTSVVPTQLIGLKEEMETSIQSYVNKISGVGSIKSLNKYFYYDHVKRGSNHYQVYVRTAHYYARYAEDIKDWLKKNVAPEIKKKKSNTLSFDILVHALHFSNAAFVEAVNEKVFNGASYTIRIEPEKEFTDNVETKFSDLKALYANLKRTNTKSEINFHFVDDNIVLGGTIYRIKHLISALFPQAAFSGEELVKVNIFSSVIVILNRLSAVSIRDYVKDARDYYYYIDLKISSMRTHEDACYLCKESRNAEILYSNTSTNALAELWIKEKENVKLKTLAEVKEYKDSLAKTDKYNRFYRRVFCAHSLNEELISLGIMKNDPLAVLKKFVDVTMKLKNNKLGVEYLMSYLSVFSEPFISYRKSNREGAFLLLILFLEMIIMNETGEGISRRIEDTENIYVKQAVEIIMPLLKMYKEILEPTEMQEYDLFRLLLKLITGLKGNYLLRADRIVPILKYNYSHQQGDYGDFILYYAALVKRTIFLNADESKSTYFELLLHQKRIEIEEEAYKISQEIGNKAKELLDLLYFENTLGIYTAIKDLNQSETITKEKLKEYYFDNYRLIMKCGNNDGDSLTDISGKLCELYEYIQKKPTGVEVLKSRYSIPFYKELCEKLLCAMRAFRVQFVVKYTTQGLYIDNNCHVVYKDYDDYRVFAESSSGNKKSIQKIFSDEQISRYSNILLFDTLYIEDSCIIVKYGNEKEGNFSVPVYVLVEFLTGDRTQMLQSIRYLLMFRNDIMQCLIRDFDNNVIQEWLEKNNTMNQLVKARAGYHMVENDVFDRRSLWFLSESFFFGKQSKVEKFCKDNEKELYGCVLGLMNNIRIGRSNIKLLSGDSFMEESFHTSQKFDIGQDDFKALKKAYFRDELRVCDRNGKEVNSEFVLPIEVFKRNLAQNKNGRYCRMRNYLLYFIFEILHSAAIYGKKENGRVNVKVYDEGNYLFFENPITNDFNAARIKASLRREGNGISLATICEFFISNYSERNVILDMNNSFKIGLPIFTD